MSKQKAGTISDDSIVEFFNRRAAEYDREYLDETPGGFALRIRRQKVLQFFDKPGGKVLDVGCGPAVMAQEILDRGCSFWGVDPSAKMIEICRGRFDRDDQAHFSIGDAMRLELPDDFFDAVLCMGVMDSLKDGRQALCEMLRVLKPGGTLIFTITNRYSPYAWWKNYVFYPLVTRWHDYRARRGDRTLNPGRRRSGSTRALYTRRAIYQWLRAERAEIADAMGYYYNICVSPLDEIAPPAALWVTRKLEMAQHVPDWLAVGTIVKARKL